MRQEHATGKAGCGFDCAGLVRCGDSGTGRHAYGRKDSSALAGYENLIDLLRWLSWHSCLPRGRSTSQEVIQPALAEGKIVLCDRFTDSTEAYQGGGRKLGSEPVLALHRILCGSLRPELTILMDSDVAMSVDRARRRNKTQAGKKAGERAMRTDSSRRAVRFLDGCEVHISPSRRVSRNAWSWWTLAGLPLETHRQDRGSRAAKVETGAAQKCTCIQRSSHEVAETAHKGPAI